MRGNNWTQQEQRQIKRVRACLLLQSYMEDHMKNKDRLEKEWEALCAYQAEPNASTVGLKDGNAKKNRSAAVVACKSLSLFSAPPQHLEWIYQGNLWSPEPRSLYSRPK